MHATIAKLGVPVRVTDLFGVAGNVMLDDLDLPDAYAHRVASLRHLIAVYDTEVDGLSERITGELDDDAGFHAVQAICGVGPVLAAVFVAEIGDVSRFPGPRQLASGSGLTPRPHESDTTLHRGHITKQGSRLVRWAALEAIARQRGGTYLPGALPGADRAAQQQGIAKVAVARRLLHLVYYGLRDGEIRCLAEAA